MLAYFLTLSSEAHSEAWTPVLLLLFTQMEKLQVQERSKFWISKVTFLLSRKRGWGDLLLQFILYYASSGALTSDQRWLSRVANDGAIRGTKKWLCSVQVCSVLRSLFLRIGVVYGISNFTNGVGHAEVMHLILLVLLSIFLNFFQVENAASWCRDEKTIWAPLWFSQWAPHFPLLMVPEIVRTNLYIPSETFQFE